MLYREPVFASELSMKRPLSPEIKPLFAMRAADILATLNCLNYLISEEAEDPAKVRHYAHMTQESLKAFAELVRPALWISEPVAA
jgi:hypothetical protein